MTLVSDTISYRPDGTISGIVRRELVTFSGPKGQTLEQETLTTVTLSEVSAVIDPAYAEFDAHNKGLEAQIERERVEAADDRAVALQAAEQAAAAAKVQALSQLADEHAAALSEKDAALSAKDAVIASKDQQLALKDAELAKRAEVAEIAAPPAGDAKP